MKLFTKLLKNQKIKFQKNQILKVLLNTLILYTFLFFINFCVSSSKDPDPTILTNPTMSINNPSVPTPWTTISSTMNIPWTTISSTMNIPWTTNSSTLGIPWTTIQSSTITTWTWITASTPIYTQLF